MNNWLSTFSKNTLAVLAIAGGMALIILSDPPHTVCDSQIERVKESERAFLYKDPKSKFQVTTRYQALRDRCKAANNAGGCYELFQALKAMLTDLENVSSECGPRVGGISEIKTALNESVDLLVRLAWGEKPPSAYHAKFRWLDTADVALFCKLKARMTTMYGASKWDALREKMMTELPGVQDLTRTQVWELVLFSENCARYP